jgi:hypothetical protein
VGGDSGEATVTSFAGRAASCSTSRAPFLPQG